MAGDSRLTTENFLRLNFTPKSGITPGTNDTLHMDCDQIKTRYNVAIAGISSTGLRLPSQNQLSSISGCPDIGDSYGGGIVAHLWGPGDSLHIEGECHGILASPFDLTSSQWGCSGNYISGANDFGINADDGNTVDILAGCATRPIAASICSTYSFGGWFLPSKTQLAKLYEHRYAIGGFATSVPSEEGYYWSSEQMLAHTARAYSFTGEGEDNTMQKSTVNRVRAIRFF